MDRIVVDDDTIVTEGNLRSLYTAPTRRHAFPLMTNSFLSLRYAC